MVMERKDSLLMNVNRMKLTGVSDDFRPYEDPTTRTWILSGVMKLSVLRLIAIVCPAAPSSSPNLFSDQPSLGDFVNDAIQQNDKSSTKWPPRSERVTVQVQRAIDNFLYSESPDIELRCREFQKLILGPDPGTPILTLHLLR